MHGVICSLTPGGHSYAHWDTTLKVTRLVSPSCNTFKVYHNLWNHRSVFLAFRPGAPPSHIFT